MRFDRYRIKHTIIVMGLIIALILLGLILLFAEILLIPGIGIAGFLGIASMGGACYYAYVDYGLTACLITSAVVVVVLALMLVWVLREKTWKRMTLDTNITAKAVVPEISVEVGDKGRSTTRLAPMGTARFEDSMVEVTSAEGIINPGVEVEVVAIDGIKVFVSPIEK